MASRAEIGRWRRALRRRRLQRQRQRGIVMLVVMFVLLMGTVGATLAVDAANNGLRAAGHNRTALQTRYMAEAELMTAAGYIELLGPNFVRVMDQSAVPNMAIYGALPIPINIGLPGASRHHASQFVDRAICALQVAGEVPPVQAGQGLDGSAAFAPAGGCPPNVADLTGTVGPGFAWVPDRFRIDVYDCYQVPQTMVAGEDQASPLRRLACVMSARGRMNVPGAPINQWTMGGIVYDQPTQQSLYEAKMSIVTPEF